MQKILLHERQHQPQRPSPNSIVPSVLLPSVEGALAYMQGGDLSRFSALNLQQVTGNARQAQAFSQYTYTLQDFDAVWGISTPTSSRTTRSCCKWPTQKATTPTAESHAS
ncbi:hypothetical protein ACQ86N_34010 [Puia sp. P3]|uniref:hypothetical protein n=1 Tax=Puia sp. P3 TaxID=3423952 RepID=UPI003D66EE0E